MPETTHLAFVPARPCTVHAHTHTRKVPARCETFLEYHSLNKMSLQRYTVGKDEEHITSRGILTLQPFPAHREQGVTLALWASALEMYVKAA